PQRAGAEASILDATLSRRWRHERDAVAKGERARAVYLIAQRVENPEGKLLDHSSGATPNGCALKKVQMSGARLLPPQWPPLVLQSMAKPPCCLNAVSAFALVCEKTPRGAVLWSLTAHA